MENEKPKNCECCNRKEHRLFKDHDLDKWICNICWKKTHNIEAVKLKLEGVGGRSLMKNEIFKIIIRSSDNSGYILKIGPYILVYTNHKKLISDLSAYLDNPESIEASLILE